MYVGYTVCGSEGTSHCVLGGDATREVQPLILQGQGATIPVQHPTHDQWIKKCGRTGKNLGWRVSQATPTGRTAHSTHICSPVGKQGHYSFNDQLEHIHVPETLSNMKPSRTWVTSWHPFSIWGWKTCCAQIYKISLFAYTSHSTRTNSLTQFNA